MIFLSRLFLLVAVSGNLSLALATEADNAVFDHTTGKKKLIPIEYALTFSHLKSTGEFEPTKTLGWDFSLHLFGPDESNKNFIQVEIGSFKAKNIGSAFALPQDSEGSFSSFSFIPNMRVIQQNKFSFHVGLGFSKLTAYATSSTGSTYQQNFGTFVWQIMGLHRFQNQWGVGYKVNWRNIEQTKDSIYTFGEFTNAGFVLTRMF